MQRRSRAPNPAVAQGSLITGVRSEREEPPESKPALEAAEETTAILLPKAERARKAYVTRGRSRSSGPAGAVNSEESFEILEFPHDPIKQYWEEQKAKEENKGKATPASSSTGLAAPPLYAAGVPRVQPPTSVGTAGGSVGSL